MSMTTNAHFALLVYAVAFSYSEGYVLTSSPSIPNPPGRRLPHICHQHHQNTQNAFGLHCKSNYLFAGLRATISDKDSSETADDEDTREGMSDAFRSLDALTSLSDDTSPSLRNINTQPTLGDLSVDPTDKDTASIGGDEMDLYADMYQQLSGSGDSSSSSASVPQMPADIAPVTPASTTAPTTNAEESASVPDSREGIDEFMEAAFEEALKEVRGTDGVSAAKLSESLMDDESLKKEIEKVFDEAGEKLKVSIQEIKDEQATLTKSNSDARMKQMSETGQRLADAEGSVSRLLDVVNQETEAVKKAATELDEVRSKLEADPLTKVADLKGFGNVPKQGALVGVALFGLRAVLDALQMGGVDGSSHATAAVIQGVLALACAAFLFLS